MNKSLAFTEEDEKEDAEEKASAAKKRHNSWHIPEFLFFDPLSAEEEKRITLAIYELKKRIKDLKRKIRKNANQEEVSASIRPPLPQPNRLQKLIAQYFTRRVLAIIIISRRS